MKKKYCIYLFVLLFSNQIVKSQEERTEIVLPEFNEHELIIKLKKDVKVTARKRLFKDEIKKFKIRNFRYENKELKTIKTNPIFQNITYPSQTDRLIRWKRVRNLKDQKFYNTLNFFTERELTLFYIDSIKSEFENIEYIEPNYILELYDLIPNDSLLNLQWYLPEIDAYQAWEIDTGSRNVKIGILDTGIDYLHPDLKSKIWINPGEDLNGNGIIDSSDFNGIDDDANGYKDDLRGWDFVTVANVASGEDPGPPDNDPMDVQSHGTHCAGIAGGNTNNGEGIAGLGWNCTLVPLRAGYKNTGGGGSLQTTDIAEGVRYAADNDVDILSMSFGGEGYSEFMNELFEYANDSEVVLIAAAGNNNSNALHYPACYKDVLAVASTGYNRIKANYSNYGDWIDVSAPGSNIYSTVPNNEFDSYSGTSMATPLVAGLAGLIKSQHPNWTHDQIKAQLKGTSEDINRENPNYAGKLGSGQVNAYNALNELPRPLLSIKSLEFVETNQSDFMDGYPDVGEILHIDAEVMNIWESLDSAFLVMKSSNPLVALDEDTIYLSGLSYDIPVSFENGIAIDNLASKGDTFDLSFSFFHTNNDTINTIIKTYIISSKLKNAKGFPVFIDRKIKITDIKADDINNDGEKEIVLGTSYQGVIIVDNEANVNYLVSSPNEDTNVENIAIADVNQDNVKEIIGVKHVSEKNIVSLNAWDISGRNIPGFPIEYSIDDDIKYYKTVSPLLSDLDNDLIPEIIIADNLGILEFLR